MGNIFGPAVGSTLVGVFNPLFQRIQFISPDIIGLLQVIIYSSLLIIMLRIMPQGLLREGISVKKWFKIILFRGNGTTKDLKTKNSSKRDGIERISILNAPQSDVKESKLRVVEPVIEEEGKVILKIEGLVKRFGGITAVNGLDLQLREKNIAALIGPNGAGKTTIFNLITGFLPVDEGRVFLKGADITGWPPNKIAKSGMVRTFQDVRLFYRTSTLENVMVAMRDLPGENLDSLFFQPKRVYEAELKTREKALNILKFVGLLEKADVLTGELGFGEQKLVSVARALATEADILLLDEPCSGVDRSQMEPILNAILELPKLGKTILVVEHNLEVVRQLASHVYFLEQGQLTAEGSMDELMNQERLATAYFGL
ncbi:MAG: ATP-binding cassette domain-containing protein [Syntrophales bacterium]|nr:ATP-binding cassette domain-containing protein [Syntrophales bacterium]